MNRAAKVLLPVAVVAGAVLVALVMVWARPNVESQRPAEKLAVVETLRVEPTTVTLDVTTQGTVEPATESDLVAEVAGRIVWVSPALANGGFFAAREAVVRIDPRDYQVALEGARAALQRAQSALSHARATLARQRSMRAQGISSEARLDEAVHAEANAAAGHREALVAVQRAELDLARTRVHAPFAGRVREKHVDLGQFVNRGEPLARLYSIDHAEVRLPVLDQDLAHLELPATMGESDRGTVGPAVRLSARVAGREESWQAHIVRSEGVRDARTRMLHVVARVEDPYALDAAPGRTPLAMGLFVDATIEGRPAEGVFDVPRSALRRNDQVLVVDADDRIRVHAVEVLRSGRDRSWVRGGLAAGDRLVISPLEVATEGMRVRVIEAEVRGVPEALAADEGPGASSS